MVEFVNPLGNVRAEIYGGGFASISVGQGISCNASECTYYSGKGSGSAGFQVRAAFNQLSFTKTFSETRFTTEASVFQRTFPTPSIIANLLR